MIAEAIYRRFFPMKSGRAQDDLRLTQLESLAIAQVESEGLEMTRAGRRFHGIFSTTGVAPVQAVPTTTASFALYNPDPVKSYVIDNISASVLSVTTGGIGGGFVAIVTPPTSTLPTNATGAAVGSRSGSSLTSKAILATGYTIPAPAGNVQWGFVEMAQSPTGTQIAGESGYSADVHGRIIVPPGKVLGLAILAINTSAVLHITGITWHEVELDLE
jgi:hypothetical protein